MSNIDLDTQNKIIKAIATHKNSENIIFDGSFALYRLLSGVQGGNLLNNRILSIIDLDLDTVNKIEELWNNKPKRQLYEESYKYVSQLLIPIFNESEHFKETQVNKGGYKIKKVKNNSLKQFIIQFTLDFKHKNNKFYIIKGDNEPISINVDFAITNGSIQHSRKSILLEDKVLKINLYESEKYFAGKLISSINHYENYIKELDSYKGKSNLSKLQKDLIDIEYIENSFNTDENKILQYLKILSNEKYNDLKMVSEYITKIKKEVC